ncbi:MAG: FGGY family carbohydrate kinase [Planctomycetaceae bacterium]
MVRILAVAQKIYSVLSTIRLVRSMIQEIWATQLAVAKAALKKAKLSAADVAGIGIKINDETTVLESSRWSAFWPQCTWQDRRTAGLCDRLKKSKRASDIRERTGLVIDAYFSGTKIAWMW